MNGYVLKSVKNQDPDIFYKGNLYISLLPEDVLNNECMIGSFSFTFTSKTNLTFTLSQVVYIGCSIPPLFWCA